MRTTILPFLSIINESKKPSKRYNDINHINLGNSVINIAQTENLAQTTNFANNNIRNKGELDTISEEMSRSQLITTMPTNLEPIIHYHDKNNISVIKTENTA
jgi:hypothetical protein